MGASAKDHWDRVYSTESVEEVSWFEASPVSSLAMIESLGLASDAPIVDLGGGSSALAGQLVARGHTDVTVVDISAAALDWSRERVPGPGRVSWVVADVRDHDFGRRFALWHDRALFHFMVSAEDRKAYLATLRRSVEPGGDLVIATFGPEGPELCSGLPVARYGAEGLAEAIGEGAELVASHTEGHPTPAGATQQFLFAHLRMASAG